ncbi:MAG: hypothetical protein M3450_11110 [Actinomycetota bacterium]|nr:hypothetical protein [Actinomycetota bacterium]
MKQIRDGFDNVAPRAAARQDPRPNAGQELELDHVALVRVSILVRLQARQVQGGGGFVA